LYEKNRREGSHPIYLYAVEVATGTTLYYTSNNANVNFYIPGTSTAQTYTAVPITHDQIESNTKGEVGSVQLTIQNVNRYVIALLLNSDALRGCKVTILLVFSDSLTDSDNYLLDEYYIDSSTVTESAAVFNLKSKFVINQVVLPSRRYKRDQCSWSFKGIECGYSGVASSCKKTFSYCVMLGNQSRYGAHPTIPTRNIYF
jgi:lambda family phage minor tail protein L